MEVLYLLRFRCVSSLFDLPLTLAEKFVSPYGIERLVSLTLYVSLALEAFINYLDFILTGG